ncbi:Pre-mRNA-processing factor 6, partial [Bonamia ostreae]
NPKKARAIIARALTFISKSTKLWLRAVRLENSREGKKAVLRKALRLLPASAKIWKTLIELEEEADAKLMLSKAVRCVPQNVDFWLALARLEDYENARRVLNEARSNLPGEPKIWIAAAKLEEAKNNDFAVKIVSKGIKSLKKHGVIIDRDFWIQSAYECEESDSPITSKAIIDHVLEENVEKNGRKMVWKADADS